MRSCSWNERPFRLILFNFCMVAWSVWLPVNPKQPWLTLNDHFTASDGWFFTSIWRFEEMPAALAGTAFSSSPVWIISQKRWTEEADLIYPLLCLRTWGRGLALEHTTLKNYQYFLIEKKKTKYFAAFAVWYISPNLFIVFSLNLLEMFFFFFQPTRECYKVDSECLLQMLYYKSSLKYSFPHYFLLNDGLKDA